MVFKKNYLSKPWKKYTRDYELSTKVSWKKERERESDVTKNGSWLIQVIVWGQKKKKKESLRETDTRICVWRKKKQYMKQ